MKNRFPLLFLLSVSVGFSAGAISVPRSTPEPVPDDVLLAAIAEVETGNNHSRLGRNGERTRLQILPQTWRRFSRMPHASATRAETDRVARKYLSVIRRRVRERGFPETPFFIAAAWNAGPEWKRLTSGTVWYAERVTNLVEASLPRRAPAVANPEEAVAATKPANPAPVIPLEIPRGSIVLAGMPQQSFFRLNNAPVFRIGDAN